jgi:hypothetical protein
MEDLFLERAPGFSLSGQAIAQRCGAMGSRTRKFKTAVAARLLKHEIQY